MEPPNGQEVTVLLDELTDRLNRHLHRLKRLEIRRAIRSPLRHLRRNWPKDAASPVPESVYHAVAQCRLSDPERVVEDWVALEEQLDTHQGRYHMQRALLAWQSPGQASWEQVCEDLAKALVLKPDLWSAVAPRLGVPRPPDHVFDAAPGEAGGATDASNAEDAMQRAGRLLECTLEQMTGRTTRCLRLWEHVAATLSPVLERGDLDAMARVASLAERCLDRWPIPAADPLGRLDPRNPVSLFLESCEKARRLVQAGQRLDARPPQWRKAREGYAEALDLGLETHDALRRAVRGLYLAICHAEDAPHVQRQRLTQLETWVDEMSDEAIRRVRESHVVQEIERLREDRMDCGRRPPKKGM
jgi:hypothetical protein